MAANDPQDGMLSGNVLFYSRPEPLNPDTHGKWGLKRVEKPFAFVKGAHLVPLTVTEFSVAAISYPIIFVGDEYHPACVMGLKDGENLFVEQDGTFDVDGYVPAFIRRVPFVFANDEQSQRMILCVDGDAPMVDKNGGEVMLFENGQPSAFTQQAMDFCREYEGERQRTDQFTALLKELDLFEIKKATFTQAGPDGKPGEPQVMAEYFSVSEAKLQALPDAKLAELVKNGAIQQIYAHLISLVNWDRLLARAVRRAQAQAPAANSN